MAGKCNRKNKLYVLTERRERVSKLYCEGLSQQVIADRIGITQGMVSKDLNWWMDQLKAEGLVNVEEKKLKELARIDNLEAAAWEAWHRSVEGAEQTTHRVRKALRKTDDAGEDATANGMTIVEEVEETVKRGSSGDPRFLERVEWCIETRLKLLGLLRQDSSNVNILNIDWQSLYKRIDLPDYSDPIEAKILALESTPSPEPAPGMNGNGKHSSKNGDGHG